MTAIKNKPAPLLTIKQFHAELGGVYGLNNLYKAARTKQLKCVKVGNKFLIPRTELTAFLEREAA